MMKITLLISLLFAVGTHAMTANPAFYEYKNPDGSRVSIRTRGGPFYHFDETEDGYTVFHDSEGFLCYEGLESTRVTRGQSPPASLKKHLSPKSGTSGIGSRHRNSRSLLRGHSSSSNSSHLYQGDPDEPTYIQRMRRLRESKGGRRLQTSNLQNLVIPILFSDHVTRPLPSREDFDVLMNNNGAHPTLAPTGSVRDVYSEMSYGQLTLTSVVIDWVRIDQTEAQCASNDDVMRQCWADALTKADVTVDFSQFDEDGDNWIDAITFLQSGYGGEWGGTDQYGTTGPNRIWSHKWNLASTFTSGEGVRVSAYHVSPAVWGTSGSAIGRIGVIAHETGHFLGLPDLYDTDNSDGNGLSSWGMMANSWGFDGSQRNPPHFCPWSKIQLGWLSGPTEIVDIEDSDVYSIPRAQDNKFVYRISAGYASGEYLLIENRQAFGFDSLVPGGGGILIYHIDESVGHNTEGYPGQTGWPGNGNHYQVSLLQRDGLYELEKGTGSADATDLWVPGHSLPATGSYPNTESYRGGNIVVTDHAITDFSASGETMTFRLTAGEVEECIDSFFDIATSTDFSGFTTISDRTDNVVLTSDDALFSFTLPSAFHFMGSSYTNLQLSSNGGLFLGSSASSSHQLTGSLIDFAPIISIGWIDMNPSASGGVHTEHRAASNQYVIEWNAPHYTSANGNYNMQVILYLNSGNIDFYYVAVGSAAPVSGVAGSTCMKGLSSVEVSTGTVVRYCSLTSSNQDVGACTFNAVSASATPAPASASATSTPAPASASATSTPAPASASPTSSPAPPPSGSITSAIFSQSFSDTDSPVTVSFGGSFEDPPVVVCSLRVDSTPTRPVLVRVGSVTTSSASVYLQTATNPTEALSLTTGVEATCLAIAPGQYSEAEHGIKMEAVRYEDGSPSTDGALSSYNGGWAAPARAYLNSYTNPVVLGFVQSDNDPLWSVYWNYGTARTAPPSNTVYRAGRSVMKDGDRNRRGETVGYVVIEAGSYRPSLFGGRGIVAGETGTTIAGITNTFNKRSTVSSGGVLDGGVFGGVVSMTGLRGAHGGFAVAYGASDVAFGSSHIDCAIDENMGSERAHTTEVVSYMMFEEFDSGAVSPSSTPAPSSSPAASPSRTPVASPSRTPVASPSRTPVASPSRTPVPSPSRTPVPSPSHTPTPSPVGSLPPVAVIDTDLPVAGVWTTVTYDTPFAAPPQVSCVHYFNFGTVSTRNIQSHSYEVSADAEGSARCVSLPSAFIPGF